MGLEPEDEVYGLKVRLTYATLINYVSRILGLIASLLFVVSVTRRLSVEEFGFWTMIFRYISYVLPLASIYSYWLPRTISRGFNTAKTGLLLSIILGSIATIAYLSISYGVSQVFNQPLGILLLASIMVLLDYVNSCLSSISIAFSPQNVGYASLTLRIVQALLGLFLVVSYRLGLYGAVLSAIGGRASSLLLQLFLNMKVIGRSKLSIRTGKEWFSKAWLPIYSHIVPSITALDVTIVRWMSGSEEAIAYYGISASLLGITLISTQSLPALYTRLLAGRNVRDIVEAFWISYMFTIPLTVGVIAYCEPILAIYNIKYVVASYAVRVFATASVFQLSTLILSTTLTGLESRDLNVQNSSHLRSTVLFKVPTYRLLTVFVYLGVLAFLTNTFKSEPTLIAASWGLAYIVREVLSQLIYSTLLKREFNITLPLREVTVYVCKFLVSSIPIVLLSILYRVEPELSIYSNLIHLLPPVLLSALGYFGVLFIVDVKMRSLTKKILREVRTMF